MVNTKFKKFLAGMLTMTLVLGSSLTVFAEDPTSGTSTGAGTFEGHVNKDVVKVSLPTQATGLYDYTIDPEGLIAATGGEKYADATFEEGKSVYFQSVSGNYTGMSASANVINMGTVDVDLTVQATTAANDKVAMVDSTDDFDGTAAQLYLELQVNDGADDEKTAAIKTDNTSDAGTIKVGLCGNADNYEVQYDETAGYTYGIKAGVAQKNWNYCNVSMTGECDTEADWSATGLTAASVTVTWSFAAQDGTQDFTDLTKNAEEFVADQAPEFTAGSAAGVINYTKGLGQKALASITKIEIMNGGVAFDAYHALEGAWNDATDSDGVITIDSQFLGYLTGDTTSAKIVGVAVDGSDIEETVTIKVK